LLAKQALYAAERIFSLQPHARWPVQFQQIKHKVVMKLTSSGLKPYQLNVGNPCNQLQIINKNVFQIMPRKTRRTIFPKKLLSDADVDKFVFAKQKHITDTYKKNCRKVK
jgi:hypothetical protein